MKKKSKWVACAALCADGTKCGRSARADVRFCHIHLGQQQRAAGIAPPDPNQFTPTERTPRERLHRIASDDKHPQQLQAIKLLMEEATCAVCAARAEQQRATDEFFSRLTNEQRVLVTAIYQQANDTLDALKAVASAQPRRDPDAEDDAKMATTPDAVPEAPPIPEQEPDDEVEAEEEEEITGPVEVEIETADGTILGTIVVDESEDEADD
jgi:hypothetical protein